jgi:hypothetical protein
MTSRGIVERRNDVLERLKVSRLNEVTMDPASRDMSAIFGFAASRSRSARRHLVADQHELGIVMECPNLAGDVIRVLNAARLRSSCHVRLAPTGRFLQARRLSPASRRDAGDIQRKKVSICRHLRYNLSRGACSSPLAAVDSDLRSFPVWL